MNQARLWSDPKVRVARQAAAEAKMGRRMELDPLVCPGCRKPFASEANLAKHRARASWIRGGYVVPNPCYTGHVERDGDGNILFEVVKS